MIEVDKLTKYYGSFPAVTDVTFRVEKGEILGLLGPNGAGKSTIMKVITGFLPPSAGDVRVAGYDVTVESVEARRHIGYLPETVPLYADMTVEDYLRFMGRIRGMSRSYVGKRINDVVGICQLSDYKTDYISKLSKGFRQRLGVAQAILHEPDVLVLDEPTIGIDPIQVVETRELIKSFVGDHTVIVSTHILPEVSMICERVIIIHEGEIVAVDTPDNLGARLRGAERIELDVKGPQEQVVRAMRAVEGVRDVVRTGPQKGGVTGYAVEADEGSNVRGQLASAVVGHGWSLLRLQSVGMTLEEIFLELTTSEEAPGA